MSRYVYERVVLIGVDGAGSFFQEAETPNIDRIFENGAVSYKVLTASPTISAECWGSMLLGVTPRSHRLTNYIAIQTPYEVDSVVPSVFRVIREQKPSAQLASFCGWCGINVGIIEDNLGVYKVNGAGGEVTQRACEYIAHNDPKFLFVQYDEVDEAGHDFGYGGVEHLEQIHVCDTYIGRIYDAYEKRGMVENTLFLVTADHGGINCSHGGLSEREKYVMYAARGKTVVKGTIGDMEIRDSAAIVLHALGLEQPLTWTSRVPSGLFEGITAGERPVCEREYDNELRMHEPKPTPAVGSGKGAMDVLGKERVLAYLPLDEDISDAAGKMQTSRNGKLYFVDGYLGNGVQFQDGSILLGEYALEKESFSVSLWVKTGGIARAAILFANKEWPGSSTAGCALLLRMYDVAFEYGNEDVKEQLTFAYPSDFRDGWVHITLVVDREKEEIRFAYDFEEFTVVKMTDELKDAVLNGTKQWIVGGGRYSELYAVLDEFILVVGALSQEDIRKLAEYYAD